MYKHHHHHPYATIVIPARNVIILGSVLGSLDQANNIAFPVMFKSKNGDRFALCVGLLVSMYCTALFVTLCVGLQAFKLCVCLFVLACMFP